MAKVLLGTAVIVSLLAFMWPWGPKAELSPLEAGDNPLILETKVLQTDLTNSDASLPGLRIVTAEEAEETPEPPETEAAPETVPEEQANNNPPPATADSTPLVIFDTDMGPDTDDVLALAMLHGYQSQGKIELAAVTVSRNSPNGVRYSDAINTFYNRPRYPPRPLQRPNRSDARRHHLSRHGQRMAPRRPSETTA